MENEDNEPSDQHPVGITNSEQLENTKMVKKELLDNSNQPNDNDQENPNVALLKIALEDELCCPFSWEADLHFRAYGDHYVDLLGDSEEMFEEHSFRFRRFIIHLVMCYRNFYKRLIEESMKNLEELEKMLYFSARKECNDVLFNTIKDALFHVVHSCRVLILLKTEQDKKAHQILPKIKSYKLMDNSNKAGIWGIRAAVYVEYGYEAVKAAVLYTNKAIDLDKSNAFWHFFKGVYLSRLRRMEKGPTIPSEEEVRCFQTAKTIHEDPAFLAFTAEVYMETAKSSKKLYHQLSSKGSEDTKETLFSYLDRCNATAANLFRKSVEMKPNSAHLLFRCGKGLMKLPPPYQDLKVAEKFLEEGLRISPGSSFGNHAMAMFTEKYKKNGRTSEYLQRAIDKKNFQAHMDFCRLKFLKDRDADSLINELTNMLNMYQDVPKNCKLIGELICCYLFLNYDLVKACEFSKRLVDSQTSWIQYICEFKSGIFPFTQGIPIVEVVVSEIGYRLNCKETNDREKDVYNRFIEFLLVEHIPLPKDIRQNILEVYLEDMERGFQKQCAAMKNTSDDEYERYEEKKSANSKTKKEDDYRNHYGYDKKNSTADVLHSLAKGESTKRLSKHRRYKHYIDEERSPQRQRKKRYDRDVSEDRSPERRQRHRTRDHSESHSETSSSSCERVKSQVDRVTQSVASLSIDAAKKCDDVKLKLLPQATVSEKVEVLLGISQVNKYESDRKSKRSISVGRKSNRGTRKEHQSPSPERNSIHSHRSKKKSHRRSPSSSAERSHRGKREDRRRTSSSSLERKSVRSHRSKKESRRRTSSPSLERKSVRSHRSKKESRRRTSSPSLERKSVRSHRSKKESRRRSPSSSAERSHRSKRGGRRHTSFSSSERKSVRSHYSKKESRMHTRSCSPEKNSERSYHSTKKRRTPSVSSVRSRREENGDECSLKSMKYGRIRDRSRSSSAFSDSGSPDLKQSSKRRSLSVELKRSRRNRVSSSDRKSKSRRPHRSRSRSAESAYSRRHRGRSLEKRKHRERSYSTDGSRSRGGKSDRSRKSRSYGTKHLRRHEASSSSSSTVRSHSAKSKTKVSREQGSNDRSMSPGVSVKSSRILEKRSTASGRELQTN